MYSPDAAQSIVFAQKPLLAFDEEKDFITQKEQIRAKLLECLGDMPEKVPLNPTVESTVEYDTFTEHRISFDVEKDVRAVCLLCIPKMNKKKYPLAICLQGHGTGMHVSMGRTAYPDEEPDDGDRDVAIQALKRGYAALSLDQRGMGERRTEISANPNDNGEPRCYVTAMQALLVGRTLLGERCWDVARAIDLALTYPEIDGERILCTGNSGGGTTTYYAACFDERIKMAMPSCAVCTYKDSIGAMHHCSCNYIPNIAKYLDMGDLAALIAPRKLIVINGKKDRIFPQNGVDETYSTIKKIYSAAGVPNNCAIATGEEGHRYYAAEAWAAFDRIENWDD
ncbi:MAG: hypothetical protein E7672_05420 [Ruminococcaceae bacterium]|nr:hypothetical protein [Oscillospiraceae bacterium]